LEKTESAPRKTSRILKYKSISENKKQPGKQTAILFSLYMERKEDQGVEQRNRSLQSSIVGKVKIKDKR
jgi:hypothetical protein